MVLHQRLSEKERHWREGQQIDPESPPGEECLPQFQPHNGLDLQPPERRSFGTILRADQIFVNRIHIVINGRNGFNVLTINRDTIHEKKEAVRDRWS